MQHLHPAADGRQVIAQVVRENGDELFGGHAPALLNRCRRGTFGQLDALHHVPNPTADRAQEQHIPLRKIVCLGGLGGEHATTHVTDLEWNREL